MLVGRPKNPDPSKVVVGGGAGRDPRVETVSPTDSVLTKHQKDWDVDHRGWFRSGSSSNMVSTCDKQEMLLDYQVSAMLHLRRAWVLQDGVQINPTQGVPQMLKPRQINPKYELAVEAADLCRWMLCNTYDSFHGVLLQLQQCDWWCNVAAELIWREQEWGQYKGKLLLDRMPLYGPQDYAIWRKDGKVIGLEDLRFPTRTKTDKPVVYPIEKFALSIFRPDRESIFGTDLARTVYLPYWMKREGQPERLKNLAQFGSPFTYAVAPEGMLQQVPLLDIDGTEMKYPVGDPRAGQTIMVTPARAMSEGLVQGFVSGGAIVLPGGAKMAMLQAQGDGRIFSMLDKDMNWAIASGILGTGTLTEEQNYGSNATAKTGQQTVNIPILSDRVALADVIKKSICTPAVRYNFSQKYWDVVPTVTCGDPKAPMWESLMTTLLNTMPAEMVTEIGAELSKRVGLPDVDFIKIRDMVDSGELPIGTVQGSNTGAAVQGSGEV